jgi:acetyl-CoA carboxylase biotin carboxyl carrier protein
MRDNMPEIAANMAGTIAEVKVSENDTVEMGQDVIILESMKMHIPIQSTHSGTVKEIKVNKGDFVNTGHVLLIIE